MIRLHPQVSVRPEPFGALLYHFGTRRLSFLKDRRLLELVQRLDGSTPVEDALAAVPERERPAFRTALVTLERTGMLVDQHTVATS
ncbi:MAG TPA: mycofactocin biosynthesis chaperone MftB [Mycobacteriales bacterium]|nr:mycofactocin biosynthesis chaperone MftB [Mycobacteriales bacterium]